eukprot:gene10183-1837_t
MRPQPATVGIVPPTIAPCTTTGWFIASMSAKSPSKDQEVSMLTELLRQDAPGSKNLPPGVRWKIEIIRFILFGMCPLVCAAAGVWYLWTPLSHLVAQWRFPHPSSSYTTQFQVSCGEFKASFQNLGDSPALSLPSHCSLSFKPLERVHSLYTYIHVPFLQVQSGTTIGSLATAWDLLPFLSANALEASCTPTILLIQ